MATKITSGPQARLVLETLCRINDMVRDADPNMPIHVAQTLLLIAANPGITTLEIEERLKLSQSTAGRDTWFWRDPDQGFVEEDSNLMNRRVKPLRLTRRGEILINSVLREMEKLDGDKG